jgi:hypothetical protein
MSFINKDSILQNELLRIAQGVPQVDEASNTMVLQGLVNKLENDLFNTSAEDTSPFSAGRENTQVFLKDLHSADDFMSFLSRNKITYNGTRLAYDHTGADDVDFMQLTPVNRAAYFKYPKPQDAAQNDFRYWVNKEGVIRFLEMQLMEANKQQNQLHITMLNKLHQQINSLSGQNVAPFQQQNPPGTTTTTTPTGNKKQPGSTSEDGTSSDKSETTNVDPQSIMKAVAVLPLKVEDISFNRIESFFKLYEPLVPSDNKTTVGNAMQMARTAMVEVSGLTYNNMTVFNLGADPLTIAGWIKAQPVGKNYLALIDKLGLILDNTEQVIRDLKESYVDSRLGVENKLPSNYVSYVYAQIGRSPTENSIYRRNKDELMTLRSQVNQTTNVGRK